jgi:DNA-binding transcriptional MerR regulator
LWEAAVTDGVSYTIGEVAAMAHVSVRTLHHYDGVGLLSPRFRSDAGYRRYTEADVERLHQILFYRELGFSLDRIADVLRSGDPRSHLEEQRRLLRDQLARVQAMVSAVDHALEALDMGTSLTPEERFQVFGDFKPEEHDAEARERWGGTEAFAESQRRTARYSKEDWRRIMAEAGEMTAAVKEAMLGGAAPTSVPVMDLAERHRNHISRWFYECSREVHRGLGEMYVSDPRFALTYESQAPGLAAYMRDAIAANAARSDA